MAEKNKDKQTLLGSQALYLLLQRGKAGTLGELLEDWKWVFRYTGRYRWAVAAYGLLGLLGTGLGLLSALAGKFTIDAITGLETARLPMVIALFLAASFLSLGLSSLTAWVSARITVLVRNRIQAETFSAVLEADWTAGGACAGGDLLHRLNSDVETVAANAVNWLPDLLVQLFSFFGSFFVIWHYDRTMALLALAGAPVLLLSSRGLLSRLRTHNLHMKETAGGLMACETEAIHHLDTIKGLDLSRRYAAEFAEKQAAWEKSALDYHGFRIRVNALLSLLGTAIQLAQFCYCLYLLWTGRIAYGTMTLFLGQGAKLSGVFGKLVSLVPAVLTCSVSANRVRQLGQLQKETRLPPDPLLLREAPQGLTVCAEAVTFSYGRETLLTDVDLTAGPGQVVAISGPSGQGKTTLLRLLLGLIHPEQGAVYLRTASGCTAAAGAAVRSLFSYVPQGNTILSGTVAQNLRLVRENATDRQLEQALRQACAWEFVSAMPGGLQAVIGEGGRGLSEGQAQRIAIARALLRDAPILLLDEATSALDPAVERQLLTNLTTRHPRRTCIITTHRPSVLEAADRIYRLRDGTLQELLPSSESAGQ